MVYGVLAEEALDKSGEIFDYARSRPHFEKWSNDFKERTAGKSVGNLRRMHQPHVAGHFEQMIFNDVDKRVEVAAKVTDAEDWAKVVAGDYTGFSIGGKYVDTWTDPIAKRLRYEAAPAEGSLVDNPCMYGATFALTRATGSEELVKFAGSIEEKGAIERGLDFLRKHLSPAAIMALGSVAKDAPAVQTPAPASAPEKIEKDAAALAATADSVLDGLKQLLSQASMMEGDPSSWTIHDIAEAMSRVLSVKGEARYKVVVEMESADMAAAAPVGDIKKADPPADHGIIDPSKEPVADAAKAVPSDELAKGFEALKAQTDQLAAAQGDLLKTVGDTVQKAVETAVGETRAALEKLEKRVEQIASTPAQAGLPVGPAQKLGTGPGGGADATAVAGEMQKILDGAKAAGATPAVMQELSIALASRLMPH